MRTYLISMVLGLAATISGAAHTTSFDMLDYMTDDRGREAYGYDPRTPALTQKSYRREKDARTEIVLMKDRSGSPFEVYTLHEDRLGNEFIALKYESGGYLGEDGLWVNDFSPDYRFYEEADFLWVPRYVYDGLRFHTTRMVEYYNQLTPNGERREKRMHPYGMQRVIRIVPELDLGGDLGLLRDVVVVHSSLGPELDWDHREDYYYAQEYGLVKWAWIEDGRIRNDAIFNRRAEGVFQPMGRWPEDTHGYEWAHQNRLGPMLAARRHKLYPLR